MDLEKLRQDTAIGKEIEDMEAFYKALDSDLDIFDRKMGICCNCESGACCKHYVPYLTPLEAQYLAFIIIKDGKEEEVLSRLSSSDDKSGICPLYNKEGSFHCSLYGGRGLLCRLFGAACFVNKEGDGIFHPCKWNKNQRTLGKEELGNHAIPIMGDYGRALSTIEGNEQETESIYIALPKAISKIKMILSLIDEDSDYNKVS